MKSVAQLTNRTAIIGYFPPSSLLLLILQLPSALSTTSVKRQRSPEVDFFLSETTGPSQVGRNREAHARVPRNNLSRPFRQVEVYLAHFELFDMLGARRRCPPRSCHQRAKAANGRAPRSAPVARKFRFRSSEPCIASAARTYELSSWNTPPTTRFFVGNLPALGLKAKSAASSTVKQIATKESDQGLNALQTGAIASCILTWQNVEQSRFVQRMPDTFILAENYPFTLSSHLLTFLAMSLIPIVPSTHIRTIVHATT